MVNNNVLIEFYVLFFFGHFGINTHLRTASRVRGCRLQSSRVCGRRCRIAKVNGKSRRGVPEDGQSHSWFPTAVLQGTREAMKNGKREYLDLA